MEVGNQRVANAYFARLVRYQLRFHKEPITEEQAVNVTRNNISHWSGYYDSVELNIATGFMLQAAETYWDRKSAAAKKPRKTRVKKTASGSGRGFEV